MNNTKELTMNKLKTIGVSALCGTLAAVSAHAGEMTVSGSANVTYMTKEKATTGAPLGITTGMTFAGSGELDNGNAVAVNIFHDDQNAFSSADVSIDVAGIGKFTVDQAGGTGLDRLDDKTPTAWEEPYDAGLGSNIVTATGVGASTDIELAISGDMLPEGLSAYISYAPEAGAGAVNDKATGGGDSGLGRGYDIVLEHSGLADGLNVFGGVSKIDDDRGSDRSQRVLGFSFAAGPVTFGAQTLKDELGANTIDYYDNMAYGVSFLVNDNLSLSYGEHKSERAVEEASKVELKTSSLQAAYTMGGATFKVARSSVDNASYSTAIGNDYDVSLVAMSLAF
jgi:outer membrane protein OmpU